MSDVSLLLPIISFIYSTAGANYPIKQIKWGDGKDSKEHTLICYHMKKFCVLLFICYIYQV